MSLEKALKGLNAGKVIVTPSESCYGFSCDALNPSAVADINKLKGRENMPMTVLISDLKQLEPFAKLNVKARALSQAFHPGSLNIIVELLDAKKYSYLSTNGLAFRIPKHQMLLDLINTFGSPITTTSANEHGEPAIYRFNEVNKRFGEQVHEIMEEGDLDETVPPSTVFDTRTNELIRQGPISLHQIQEVINKKENGAQP